MLLTSLILSLLSVTAFPVQESAPETTATVIGRLCSLPVSQNDNLCCLSRLSSHDLITQYPSVFPPGFTCDPENLVLTGPNRLEMEWRTEMESKWMPGVIEPYKVKLAWRMGGEGIWVLDLFEVLSPRCMSFNVTRDCLTC